MDSFPKLSSQASGASAPNTTPRTEAAAAGDVDVISEPDLTAVSQHLEPVQEEVNEAAEMARYPSAPGNTPASAATPAPSVSNAPPNRNRGHSLSLLPSRLAQLTLASPMRGSAGGTTSEGNDEELTNDGGVSENSDWADDALADLERALARIQQLASDQHHHDPSHSEEDIYLGLLKSVLESPERKFPTKLEKMDK